MHIGFVFATAPHDWHLAPRLVAQIQQHHPGAEILCLPDGFDPEPSPGVPTVASTTPLKRPGSIHTYSYRKLALALESMPEFDVLVQLDPDTSLIGSLPPMPSADWFGVPIASPSDRG